MILHAHMCNTTAWPWSGRNQNFTQGPRTHWMILWWPGIFSAIQPCRCCSIRQSLTVTAAKLHH